MGLFDKLFDKKVCAICGGEIGLLGNRKLADGNLCKDCAAKLSPFMTDRRESTVEEIRDHLEYRRRNAMMLPSVHPTKVFGHRTKVYVDENTAKFFVTASTNWQTANPDIIDVDQVIECRVEAKESREQLYHRDPKGNRVPFNPPRYRSEFRFIVTIMIDSPYFNEISFELTDDRPDSPLTDAYRAFEQEAAELKAALSPATYAPAQPSIADRMRAMAAARAAQTGVQPEPPKPTSRLTRESAPAKPTSWKCACGAVNDGNFCANCGAKRPKVYRCDKCGWMPEDPNNLPKFCPQCGDRFDSEDVK